MLMNFLQFFIWGFWLVTLGGYMIVTLRFSGNEVGNVYSTLGIASLFMPGLLGIVADKWVNAERLYGICHLIGACLLYWASTVTDAGEMYRIMLLNAMVYMPTIALNYSISYKALSEFRFNLVKDFPPIRVWGTFGLITAMWIVDLMDFTVSNMQLQLGAAAAACLGIYAFTLPQCPPARAMLNGSLATAFGLKAFAMLKEWNMAVFFIFSMLLGAALQITNSFGIPFLHDFAQNPSYKDSFVVNHPNILMSISQISEIAFILSIPFFMGKLGIKKVMLMSMFAWVVRFGFFGMGNPADGLSLLVLSMIVYGMAYDFFCISASLYVEMTVKPEIRSSAQGLFMIMTNGLGAFLGARISGWVVDAFTVNGIRNWELIWFAFAAYALVIGVAFAVMFRYKHQG